MKIVLSTLNARYIHASLGLRYLLANMGDLRSATELKEFVITQSPADIAEQILNMSPTVVGFGVYIWNVVQTDEVIAILKRVAPQLVVVIGGPEVSYEHEGQAITQRADYVITGMADAQFPALCQQIAAGATSEKKVIASPYVAPNDLVMPYNEYTDDDIAHRLIYVEASRGCPFKCEFCLSALDKTATPFNLDHFLNAMDGLYKRGVRHFKFVDRTFNLKAETGARILEFFLERLDDHLFLHFEVIPDRLPVELRSLIPRFPPGTLQFEIGIQTLNPTVQAHISRRQDNEKSLGNLRWLAEHSNAHLHVDLIAGLPGEDLDSFGRGFDALVGCSPHEIQVGILKRLRGAPIARHSKLFDLRFNPNPPYNILSTRDMNFTTLQRVQRFARYWDMTANSGRFSNTMSAILADQPFNRFMALSDWLYANDGQPHGIALKRVFELVYKGLISALGMDSALVIKSIREDFERSGQKGTPSFLRDTTSVSRKPAATQSVLHTRQLRHLR